MSRAPAMACVLGDMDLVRPLGFANIPCAVATSPGAPVRWSRYVSASIDLPDLWTESDQAVETLIAFAKAQDSPPVLFYQSDAGVVVISRYREALEPWFRFIAPPADLVEDVVDKERFQQLAAERGLPVPVSRCARIGVDPLNLDETVFPAMVKPSVRSGSDEEWMPFAGLAKALLLSSPDALIELWRSPELQGLQVLVQEFVPGDERQVVSYHTFIDDDGSVVGDFTGRKIRTKPPNFGQSTAVEITDDPQVRAAGLRDLRALGYHGVAKLDYKIAPDGNLRLLEINPRFSLWNHPGAVAGVNIPVAMYQKLTGGTVDPISPASPGVTWCNVWRDAPVARATGTPLREWLRFALDSQSRRVLNLDDPGTAFGALLFGGRRAVRRIGRRLRRG